MTDIFTSNYNITEITTGVYTVVGYSIGLVGDVLAQLRTDYPDLVVLGIIVTFLGKIFRPIAAFMGSVMGAV